MWPGLIGVSLHPQLPHRSGLLQLSRTSDVLVAGDLKFLPFADPIAQLESLIKTLIAQFRLGNVVVRCAESVICHGEFGIKFDSALEQRYGCEIALAMHSDNAGGIGFERIE